MPELLVDRPPPGLGSFTALELAGNAVIVGMSCGSLAAYAVGDGQTSPHTTSNMGSTVQAHKSPALSEYMRRCRQHVANQRFPLPVFWSVASPCSITVAFVWLRERGVLRSPRRVLGQALIMRRAFVRRSVEQLCAIREHGVLLVLCEGCGRKCCVTGPPPSGGQLLQLLQRVLHAVSRAPCGRGRGSSPVVMTLFLPPAHEGSSRWRRCATCPRRRAARCRGCGASRAQPPQRRCGPPLPLCGRQLRHTKLCRILQH